jgi:hypothetical protein
MRSRCRETDTFGVLQLDLPKQTGGMETQERVYSLGLDAYLEKVASALVVTYKHEAERKGTDVVQELTLCPSKYSNTARSDQGSPPQGQPTYCPSCRS